MSNTIQKMCEVLDDMNHDSLVRFISQLSSKYDYVDTNLVEQELLKLAWRMGSPYGNPCQKIFNERDSVKEQPVFIL